LLLIGGANLSVLAESLERANLNGILQTNILDVINDSEKEIITVNKASAVNSESWQTAIALAVSARFRYRQRKGVSICERTSDKQDSKDLEKGEALQDVSVGKVEDSDLSSTEIGPDSLLAT